MDKLLANLGLCRKAGKLICGFDAAVEAMENGEGYLLLTASEISPKTEKEIIYKAKSANFCVYKLPYIMADMELLSKKRVGIFAITDENLAKLIEKAFINTLKD